MCVGTTGNPKAVMVSHDNVLFVTSCVVQLFSETASQPCCSSVEERFLSYLPLSHGAGMMVDIIFPMCATAISKAPVSVAFARNYDLSKVGRLEEKAREQDERKTLPTADEKSCRLSSIDQKRE